MLQYDEIALRLLALTFISCYVIPSWYCIIRRIHFAFTVNDNKIGAGMRTRIKKEADILNWQVKGLGFLASRRFLIHLAPSILFTTLLACNVPYHSTKCETFDPFSILGIEPDSDLKAIKRAYRAKALVYHPDRNPYDDDPAAKAKFMMVIQAYEVLIDEAAKANWKSGNPCGSQQLPSFDLKSRNAELIAYLVIMIGLILLCALSYFASWKFEDKYAVVDTHTLSCTCLIEHSPAGALTEFMGNNDDDGGKSYPVQESQASSSDATDETKDVLPEVDDKTDGTNDLLPEMDGKNDDSDWEVV